jgi:hypothetical protein
MGIKLLIDLVVKDTKTGKIEKHIHRKSHSFDLQFLQLMIEMNGFHVYNGTGTSITVKDTGNASRTMQTAGGNVNLETAILAANTDATYGIVVGTGSNATSPSDVALQTQVANGAGAGQLGYGPCGYTTSAISGANVNLVLTRALANTSGGTINVTELGIYMESLDAGSVARFFCAVRDLITSVPVPTAKTLTVTYTFTTAN